MTLRQATREIIKLVEEISGIPVRVVEEPLLSTTASVRMARKGVIPNHLILYKPEPGKPPDYQICFECAHIIRMFQNPPAKRFVLAGTEKGSEEIKQMITAPGGVASKLGLLKDKIIEMTSQYLEGLLVHLRFVPTGFRVSTWLSNNYPELAMLEKKHVQNEIDINRQTLKIEIKNLTPPIIYLPAQYINAAYALYWAKRYNKPDWSNPYHLQNYEKDGQALLDIYNQIPDNPTHDQELIDAWGKYLDITDWYAWLPYES